MINSKLNTIKSIYPINNNNLSDLEELDKIYINTLKDRAIKENKPFDYNKELEQLNNQKLKFNNENINNIEEFKELLKINNILDYINNLKLDIKELKENKEELKNKKEDIENKLKTIKNKEELKELRLLKEDIENNINDIDFKISYYIENKKSIKELKENKKELIDKNLNNKLFNIYHLEEFISNLDKNDKKIINDKKNINKLWKILDLQDKSIYEQVINYFILLYLDKDYFLNLDYLNQKIKSIYSKKELKQLEELNSFSFKELKSNFLDNYNNKYILDYIREYEGITKSNSINLDNVYSLLLDKEDNKDNYRFNLLLINKNKDNLKNYKEFKNKYYKQYQKIENSLNMSLKRKTFKLKEKYSILDNNIEYKNNKLIFIDKDKELKEHIKACYKKRINYYKYNLHLINTQKDYIDLISSKNIRYLNYINNNLDLDLDKDKRFKSLKTLYKIELKSK